MGGQSVDIQHEQPKAPNRSLKVTIMILKNRVRCALCFSPQTALLATVPESGNLEQILRVDTGLKCGGACARIENSRNGGRHLAVFPTQGLFLLKVGKELVHQAGSNTVLLCLTSCLFVLSLARIETKGELSIGDVEIFKSSSEWCAFF